MAPPGWMTPAQRAVVLPFFPDYSKYQASKKLYKFWPLVYEAWFHAFPEEAQLGIDKVTATVEGLDALRRATEKRKGQLQTWFRNQRVKTARAAGHTTTLSNTTLTSALFTGKPKRSRIHKPIEVFQQRNGDRIRTEYAKQGIDMLSSEPDHQEEDSEAQVARTKELRRTRLNLRRDIVNQLYTAASEKELAEVSAVIQAERASKEAKKEEESKNTTELHRERSPEEYQNAIDESVDTVNKFLKLMYEKTGWFAFITWGGPNPRLGGQLSVKSDCIGQTPSGNDFIAQHAQYQEGICMPFAQFLQRSFGPSGLACRALPGTLTSNAGDGDVGMAPVLPVVADEVDTDAGLAPQNPETLSAHQAFAPPAATSTLSPPTPTVSQDTPAALSPPASPPSPLPLALHLPSEDEDDPWPNIDLADSLVPRPLGGMPWDMDWFFDAAGPHSSDDSLPDDRCPPSDGMQDDGMQDAGTQAITPIQTGLGIMYSWPSPVDISVPPATTGVATDISSSVDVQTMQLPPRPQPRPRYRNAMPSTPSTVVTSPATLPVSSPLAVTSAAIPGAPALSPVTPSLPPAFPPTAPSLVAQTPAPGPSSDSSLAPTTVSFPRSRQVVNPPKTATRVRAGAVAATLGKKAALKAARAARAAKAQQTLKKSMAARRAVATRAVEALPDVMPVDPTPLASITPGIAHVPSTTDPAVNPTTTGLVFRNGDDTNRKELKRVRARKALQDKVSYNPDGMHPLVIFTRRNPQRERKAPAPADAQYVPKTKMLTLAEQRAQRDAPFEEALLKRASANTGSTQEAATNRGAADRGAANRGVANRGAAKTRSARITRAAAAKGRNG